VVYYLSFLFTYTIIIMRSFTLSMLLAALVARVCAAIGPVANLTAINLNIAPDGFIRSSVTCGHCYLGDH